MDSCQTRDEQEDTPITLHTRTTNGNKRKRRCSQISNEDDQTPYKKTTPNEDNVDKQSVESKIPLINASAENNEDDATNKSNSTTYYDEDQFSLEHFCDELLYEVFKFLDTWSLMTLMNVSKRFQKFVLDKRLWEDIDLSQEPLPLGILEDMLERSHEKTRSIKLRGPSPSQHIEGEIQHFNITLRNSLTTRCTKLLTLELFGVTLDFNLLTFSDFPKTLKRLVLNNCHVRVDPSKSIFTGVDAILTNLDELAIEKNSWFDPYYVMPISKLPALRYLSLKGCSQMQEFIPYGSIAGRHGFKQLEVLDLSNTPLNDSDLQCFNAVETLKEIYLQCPESDETQTVSTSSSKRIPISNGTSITKTTLEEQEPSTSSKAPVTNKDLDDSPSTSSSSSNSSLSSGTDVETSSPQSSNRNSQSDTNVSSVSNNASANVIPIVGSNAPTVSRFLPRPDHIICLDLRNRTSPNAVHININVRDRSNFRHLIMPGQQPGNQQQQQNQQSPPPAFEQMIRHNLFWDIINPLGRVTGGGGPDRLFGEENEMEFGAGNHDPFSILSRRPIQRGSISDRGVCCFGRTRQPVHHGVIWIRFNNRPSENRFERFSVRDYKYVTDVSLQHLVQCSPNLVFLDVSGTSVTLDGIKRFKELKPECKLVAEHIAGASVL